MIARAGTTRGWCWQVRTLCGNIASWVVRLRTRLGRAEAAGAAQLTDLADTSVLVLGGLQLAGAASSLLHLASLRAEDAGRYSCHSDLAAPASVRVIVASGDSAVAALLQCCEQKRPCRPHHA